MDAFQASVSRICPSATTPPAYMLPGSQKDFSEAATPGAPFKVPAAPQEEVSALGFTRSCPSLTHPEAPSFLVTPSLTFKEDACWPLMVYIIREVSPLCNYLLGAISPGL